MKVFADHNSNAAQIIGFDNKLKYCAKRRKYWFPGISCYYILTLKALDTVIDVPEGLYR